MDVQRVSVLWAKGWAPTHSADSETHVRARALPPQCLGSPDYSCC